MERTENSQRGRSALRRVTAALALAGIGVGCFLVAPGSHCLLTVAASSGGSISAASDGVPRVSVDLSRLADDALRLRLESGLPQTLVARIDAFDHGDGPQPVATVLRTCAVRYDEWDARYSVWVNTGAAMSAHTATSTDEVIDVCLDLHDLEIGCARDWAGREPSEAFFVADVELNPLSPETAQRVHVWLEQADLPRSHMTFFGPFVGLFVDWQIGVAERDLGSRGTRDADVW